MGASKQEQPYTLYNPNEEKSSNQEGRRFMQVGVLGGLLGVGYMMRNAKNRGDLKLSVYVIHTRLLAQGTVIGVLCLGMGYEMYKKMYKSPKPDVNTPTTP